MGLLMFHPWTEVSSAPTSKFFFIPLPSPSLLLLIIHWDLKNLNQQYIRILHLATQRNISNVSISIKNVAEHS